MRGTHVLFLTLLFMGMVRADDPSVSFWNKLPFAKSGDKGQDAERKHSEPPEQAQARARLNWHRRVAVINKLREIGLRVGDQELLRQADMLDQRAFEVYMQHTGRIVPIETEKQP